MKPEDLIQGKKYIDRVYRDKVLRFIDFNDRDYGIYKDDTWIFEDFNGKEIILNARWIENLDEEEAIAIFNGGQIDYESDFEDFEPAQQAEPVAWEVE